MAVKKGYDLKNVQILSVIALIITYLTIELSNLAIHITMKIMISLLVFGTTYWLENYWKYVNPKLKEKILESLSAVLPITGIVLLLSIFLVPLGTGAIVMFFVGAVLLIVGMGMFQLGAEMAMSPLGEGIGVQISKSKHLIFIALISLLMGVLITMAEPDLQVLSD